MSRARDLADSADKDISGTLNLDGLDVAGNITVTGTVDGRDVATDGTKLDGVEANATADQTGAEIKAAYEGEADTNAYTDAEKTKLSGIETGATADQTKADIDALNINADTLDGQHGSYYTGYADTAVANLVDSAPGTLDTLNELAAALGDDPNFATTVTNSIATKLPLAGGTLTGALTGTSATFTGDVGVGTTSPDTKLHVSDGHLRVAGTETSGSFLNISASNTGSDGVTILASYYGSGSYGPIKLRTGGSERMRIDSSGKVIIGNGVTADAGTLLTVGGAATFTGQNTAHGASRIKIGQDTTAISQIRFYGADTSTAGILQFTGSSSDGAGGSERMRIDSSGNLLVGKTSSSIANDGFQVHNTGYIGSTNSGASTAYFNRKTNDGDIINFQKDGTAVGSIGTQGGDLWIGTGNIGAYFLDGSDAIIPWNTSTNAARGSAIDFGTSGTKFRNGYFSNAVYGNTFSAVSYIDTPDIYLGGNLYHNGDTNTYISFSSNDNIAIATGGTNRIYVDNSGVRIGDTGNAYVRPVSGNYGSFEIHGGSHTGWEGYSISGRAVFMHDSSNSTGLYDDVNNNWLFYGIHGGATSMSHNGSTKIQTTSGGAAVTGALTATGNITAYYSDERLKTKTGDLDGALEKIKQLNGFYYVENDLAKELGFDNDEQQVALSAQEVQAVMPEAVSLAPFDMAKDEETGDTLNVSASGEDYLTVDYARLVPLLVEAIKELKAEIEELKHGSTN